MNQPLLCHADVLGANAARRCFGNASNLAQQLSTEALNLGHAQQLRKALSFLSKEKIPSARILQRTRKKTARTTVIPGRRGESGCAFLRHSTTNASCGKAAGTCCLCTASSTRAWWVILFRGKTTQCCYLITRGSTCVHTLKAAGMLVGRAPGCHATGEGNDPQGPKLESFWFSSSNNTTPLVKQTASFSM